jgi:hexulose-6-phosphate isomerase
MNPIGVMQGRLLPPIEDKIQAHPGELWRDEFPAAKECGLDLIEWIFEGRDWQKNAIMTNPDEIIEYSQKYNIKVITLIADFFMDCPLLRVSPAEVDTRMTVFEGLLKKAGRVGVKYLNVPFVDNSEITSDAERDQVAHLMSRLLPQAEQLGMEIALETSLNPKKFRQLLDTINHPLIKVNYDIGNSAALGYDPAEEMDAYGTSIATVHIKDRVLGGSTVPLGQGDSDFDTVFSKLAGLNYTGPFTLQAARNGDEKTATKNYLEFVNNYLNKYFNQ